MSAPFNGVTHTVKITERNIQSYREGDYIVLDLNGHSNFYAVAFTPDDARSVIAVLLAALDHEPRAL